MESERLQGSSEAVPEVVIEVRDLKMAYGDFVVLKDISFDVRQGEILAIMGGSGCGKSTLLKHLIGLLDPAEGTVKFDGIDFVAAPEDVRRNIQQGFGVLYQQGALWSSMTLAENVALPLATYTRLKPLKIRRVVEFKLALVGLAGFGDFLPAQLSGGMRKRAALARAIALDPKILFFDEPSAGLDPVTSRRLDELILQLRESLGTTIVLVTHELDSLFTLADRALFLDAKTKTGTALGDPRKMRDDPPNPEVGVFLRRGSESPGK